MDDKMTKTMPFPDALIRAAAMLDRWEHHWHGINKDLNSWAMAMRQRPPANDAYWLRFHTMVAEQKGLADELREMASCDDLVHGRAAQNERLRRAVEHASDACARSGMSSTVSIAWLLEQMMQGKA